VWNDTAQQDTLRLEAIKTIARKIYLNSKPDSSLHLAGLQYDLANATGNKKWMAQALITQGDSYYFKGDYTESLAQYEKAIKLYKTLGNKLAVASASGSIGKVHKKLGNHAKAIQYYTRNLKIYEELGNKQGIAGSLMSIGIIHWEQLDFTRTLDYFTRSLRINEELENKFGIASGLVNTGTVYKKIGELDNNANGSYEKAIDNFDRSLKIFEELGHKYGIAACYNNIGMVNYEKGNYPEAIDWHTKSLKLREEMNNKMEISQILNNIGNDHYAMGDHNKALDYSSRALAYAREIGDIKQIKEASHSLWKVYKDLGRYQKALSVYELHIELRDSILSEKNQKEVIRQEYKYTYEKQAAADSIKAAEAAKVKDAQLLVQKAENKQQRQRSYFLYGGLALALLFGGFIFNRYRVTNKQKGIIEEQKEQVEEQKSIVESAHEQLGEKNKEIMDSINYAKRIQSAILPPVKLIKEHLQDSFVLYKPKDIVAGDFYWIETLDEHVLFAAADCTGHGVPGAMVSVVCNNGLNRSVREYGLSDPGKILDRTRDIVIQEFEKSEEEVKDGMDIALCSLQGTTLAYAGAHNPLWIVRNGATETEEIRADKQPIGKYDDPLPYTTHRIELQPGDTFYIFSDGYADQFGGEKGKKLKSSNFKKLLLSLQQEPMQRQEAILDEAFDKWKGNIEQLDDVCVIGVRV